ncbi:unnamed protein product, partial [Allacma fusca]
MEYSVGKIANVEKASEFVEAFDFEVYDILGTVHWFHKYRFILWVIIGLYLFGVYFGQKWMKNRPPFKLTFILFFWNFGLALFSIICTWRGIPEFLYLLSKPDGVYLVACDGDPHNFATSFWVLALFLSKLVELGDTAFIILRKQKLITLHWFHHAATLTLCWIGYEHYEVAGRAIFVNTFVHSFMYF